MVQDGCPAHGPVHSLVASAAGIGFVWDPHLPGWARPGLPGLSNLVGPKHFKSAFLGAWRKRVSADLCAWEGFRGGLLMDIVGLHNSSHVRERD